MSTWIPWIKETIGELLNLRAKLGTTGSEPGPESDLGKRQCVYEAEAVELVKKMLPQNAGLLAEGYNPVNVEGSKVIVSFDPIDGTAGYVRSYNLNFRSHAIFKSNLPVTSVIAIRRADENKELLPTFGSVISSGILDLRSDQSFFLAEDGMVGARQNIPRTGPVIMRSLPQYNLHSPNVASEVARRANAFHRFLIPYGLYPEMVADSHSSAMVMLWCLSGYLDVWFNFNLPGIVGAGQRGHELSAIAVFARTMKACAFWTHVVGDQVEIGGPLDEAPYTFDGQTSVILGVDEKIVRHYLGLINQSLRQEIRLSNGTLVRVSEVLKDLYKGVPNERWSLPLVE